MAADGTRIMVNIHKVPATGTTPEKRKRTHLLFIESGARFGDGTLGTAITKVADVTGSDDDRPGRKVHFKIGTPKVHDEKRMTVLITFDKHVDPHGRPFDATPPTSGSLAVTITNTTTAMPPVTTDIPTTLIPVNYIADPAGCDD